MRSGTLAKMAVVIAAAAVVGALTAITAWAGGPSASVSSAKRDVGGSATVTLRANEIAPPGLGAWTVDVTYDSDVVSVTGCTAAEGGLCNESFGPETVRITGVSAFGLEGTTVLGTITLRCDAVGASDLVPSAEVFHDATPGGPEPIDAAMLEGRLTCNEEEPEPTPEPLRGDANCDGQVTSVDATVVLQFTGGLISSVGCPENADANNDGEITSVDATVILQIVGGLL